MSVTALSARTGRHTSQPSGPGRAPAPRRAAAVPPPAAAPALTVTLAIPLDTQAMSPQVHRLLEIVRDLVAVGQGSVTVTPSDGVAAPGGEVLSLRRWVTDPIPDDAAAEAVAGGDADAPRSTATEVRLLTASRQVLVGGVPLPMTRLEFDLLQFLADNPRRVFSRAQLLSAVWGYEHTGERTVDVHVRRLRVKIGVEVPLVTTVYGVGYRLADEANLVVVPHA
ncbi:MAG TPA: winged helix-turn-helix domain-containing protein [Actinoplanes sp.]|nr:winged helix-turn-helix domain-containing protein [Actinoplanes sp.]